MIPRNDAPSVAAHSSPTPPVKHGVADAARHLSVYHAHRSRAAAPHCLAPRKLRQKCGAGRVLQCAITEQAPHWRLGFPPPWAPNSPHARSTLFGRRLGVNKSSFAAQPTHFHVVALIAVKGAREGNFWLWMMHHQKSPSTQLRTQPESVQHVLRYRARWRNTLM